MKKLAFVLFCMAIIAACTSKKDIPSKTDEVKNTPTDTETTSKKDYVEGELIVVFKNEKTYEAAAETLAKQDGVELIKMLMVAPPDAIIGHFKVPKGKEKEMITVFQTNPEVKYAELNMLGSFGGKMSSADSFVKGKVEAVENGKDGYTARIKTADGEVYSVTISIPNLGRDNADQFRDVKVGEVIEVSGEHWMMGDEKQITVRALKPAKK